MSEETPQRPPDEEAEDQSDNAIGFRNVDEQGDYDEAGRQEGGRQEGDA